MIRDSRSSLHAVGARPDFMTLAPRLTVRLEATLRIGFDTRGVEAKVEKVLAGTFKKGAVPPL